MSSIQRSIQRRQMKAEGKLIYKRKVARRLGITVDQLNDRLEEKKRKERGE